MTEPLTSHTMARDYVYALYCQGHLALVPQHKITARERAINFALSRGVSVDDFFGTCRTHNVSHARQDYMAKLRAEKKMSLSQIGRLLNRNHATIKHGVEASIKRGLLSE